jgi:hypothetical protein
MSILSLAVLLLLLLLSCCSHLLELYGRARMAADHCSGGPVTSWRLFHDYVHARMTVVSTPSPYDLLATFRDPLAVAVRSCCLLLSPKHMSSCSRSSNCRPAASNYTDHASGDDAASVISVVCSSCYVPSCMCINVSRSQVHQVPFIPFPCTFTLPPSARDDFSACPRTCTGYRLLHLHGTQNSNPSLPLLSLFVLPAPLQVSIHSAYSFSVLCMYTATA